MTFLSGLHGALATILLCVLLYIDEAGVPMPFAPSEVLLVVAGMLLATGALSPFVFFPLAILSMIVGSFTGYSWARKLGPTRLRVIAVKLRATRAFDRATIRMRHADAGHIAVARVIPGIRPYATLIAGAAEVDLHTFMRGNVIALIGWCTTVTTLGFVVGVPAEHLLNAVERFAVSGGLFILLGVMSYRAARKSPPSGRGVGPFDGVAMPLRHLLAVTLDAGVVATITVGFDQISRSILHIRSDGNFVDGGMVAAAIALSYIVASRRGSRGETAGERVFDVSYVHPRTGSGTIACTEPPGQSRRNDATHST